MKSKMPKLKSNMSNLGSVSHDKEILSKLNIVATIFGESEILHTIFQDYFDNEDIENITNFLIDRMEENGVLNSEQIFRLRFM